MKLTIAGAIFCIIGSIINYYQHTYLEMAFCAFYAGMLFAFAVAEYFEDKYKTEEENSK